MALGQVAITSTVKASTRALILTHVKRKQSTISLDVDLSCYYVIHPTWRPAVQRSSWWPHDLQNLRLWHCASMIVVRAKMSF